MNKEEINAKLVDVYGLNVYSGKPKFRVVFSDDEREIRKGIFQKFDENGVITAEYHGTVEWPKYSYLDEKFVLEQLVPNFSEEIVGEKMIYEPFYIFQNENGDALPLIWDAVEAACNMILSPPPPRKIATEEEYWAGVTKSYLDHINAVADSELLDKLVRGTAILNPKERN